jgi:hypothetical protein
MCGVDIYRLSSGLRLIYAHFQRQTFLLTLWLPCVAVIFWLTSQLRLHHFHLVCLAMMVIDILFVWPHNLDGLIY